MLLNLQHYQHATKFSQDTDLHMKRSKENANYFVEFICIQFNDSLRSSQFLFSFGYASIIPIFKDEYSYPKYNCKLVVSVILEKTYEQLTFDVSWKNCFEISVWFAKSFQYLTMPSFDV